MAALVSRAEEFRSFGLVWQICNFAAEIFSVVLVYAIFEIGVTVCV